MTQADTVNSDKIFRTLNDAVVRHGGDPWLAAQETYVNALLRGEALPPACELEALAQINKDFTLGEAYVMLAALVGARAHGFSEGHAAGLDDARKPPAF